MFQIGGLASGLDTKTLIEQLMQIESRPISIWRKQQDQLRSEAGVWKDVEARLQALRDKAGALLSADAFYARRVSVSDQTVARASVTSTATTGQFEIVVTSLAKAHRIAGIRVTDVNAALGASGAMQINGVGLTVVSTDSLVVVRDKINALNAGVRASLIDNTLVLESTTTGSASTITVTGDASVLQSLGLDQPTTLQSPADAQLTVNGLPITSASNRLTNLSSGLTVDLVGTGTTIVTVENDTQAVLDRVKAFVDQFNSAYGFIQEKLAKEATLQGDSTLIRLGFDLRTRVTSPVAGTPSGELDQLALVGITTDRYGRLSVDEAKFTKLLTEKPEEVRRLFQATLATDGREGVITRLDGMLRLALQTGSGVVPETQEALNDRIKDIDRQIEAFERRLELRRQHLVQQFTALEKALSAMQSQSNWLAGQIQKLQQS